MSVGRGNYQRTPPARNSLSALSRLLLGIWMGGTLLLAGCGEGQLAKEATAVAAPNDKVAEAIRRVLLADQTEQTPTPFVPEESPASEQDAAADVVAAESTEPEQPPELGQEVVAEAEPEASAEVADAVKEVVTNEQEVAAIEQVIDEPAERHDQGHQGPSESQYFSWTATDETEADLQLPPEEEAATRDESVAEPSEPESTESLATEAPPATPPPYVTTPFATLLPPQMVDDSPQEIPVSAPAPASEGSTERVAIVSPEIVEPEIVVPMQEPKTPEVDGLSDEERQLVEQVIRESSPAVTGVLTDARVNEMATTSIREANALANRGAQYAARQKLIEVLRMVSQAKDAHAGDRLHTSALAAGLRALDEAEDFSPRGTQLEAELEVSLVVAAHRTPIARRLNSPDVLPRQMMDLYFRYAQVKLATSVAGEPSGSMALYALGKVTSQMGKSEADRHRISHRRAVAFQQAALLAHNQNYFAAHELAVLLAESGHLLEAESLLKQVAARQPNPSVYRNLAHVQQRLGRTQLAANSRAFASQLAGRHPTNASQIRWVGPEAFGTSPVRPAQYAGPARMPPRPSFPHQRTAVAPPPRSHQQPSPIPPGSWR